jgi:hypothetical protein
MTHVRVPDQTGLPATFRGGGWTPHEESFLKKYEHSMLPELLEKCGPFIEIKVNHLPDGINVNFHMPSREELFDFVCAAGVGAWECTNDTNLSTLTNYIYDLNLKKFQLGTPKNKPILYKCGYSCLSRDTAKCLHGGTVSDYDKCIFVLTKSEEPIWSPRCPKCVGRSNPINLENAFRRPQTNKRGRRHEFVILKLERALAASLELVFKPGRVTHALNLRTKTPAAYLEGTVDQEMMSHKGNLAKIHRNMPINASTNHVVGSALYREIQDKFARLENPRFPNECIFGISVKNITERDARCLIEAHTQPGGGYMSSTRKGTQYIVAADTYHHAKRINEAKKSIEKDNIPITFEARLATKGQIYKRIETMVAKTKEVPFIIFDENNSFHSHRTDVEKPRTVSQLYTSLRKLKRARFIALHADQMGYRKLAMVLEAIDHTLHVNRIKSVEFVACYSKPRSDDPEKGQPVLTKYCRGQNVIDDDFDWKRISGVNKNDAMSLRRVMCISPPILANPEETAMDVGTFLASVARDEPWPRLEIVFPNVAVETMFNISFTNKQRKEKSFPEMDVLDLVEVNKIKRKK